MSRRRDSRGCVLAGTRASTKRTVPSPLCLYDAKPCPRGGRAVLGPRVRTEGAINQTIRCLGCKQRGVLSLNLELRRR